MAYEGKYPETLADVLAILSHDGAVQTKRKRDGISAISRVSAILYRPPADLPASVPKLRGVIATIHPVQHGICAKPLSNTKASLANALRRFGVIPDDERGTVRTDKWDAFLDHAEAQHHSIGLSRFATYCGRRGIEPEDVTDDTMSAFKDWLEPRLLIRDPADIREESCQIWNGIVGNRGLNLAVLSYERRRHGHLCRPMSVYPDTLRAELSELVDRLTHAEIFADAGPDKPLKPTSVRNTLARTRQFLDGLVCSGRDPNEFAGLTDITTAANMKAVFAAIRERRQVTTWSPQFGLIAATIVAIAKHHVKVEPAELKAIVAVKLRVTTQPKGMSAKNTERLGQFND